MKFNKGLPIERHVRQTYARNIINKIAKKLFSYYTNIVH